MSDAVKNQTEGKEIAEVSDEDLARALAESTKHQEKENEGDGVKADYILLAKQGTKALSKFNKELFIEGLKQGDLYIQKDKKVLGAEVKVVPLAFITLYNEKENASKDSKFFGTWNKEQAVTFPTTSDSDFNRQLPNGHILVPVNWVMVQVVGHDEIENGVIAFKSTGNRIWRKWKEDAKTRSATSATLVYKITEEQYKNDKFEWTDFGFEYVESLLDTDKKLALFCLNKSNAIRDSYEKHVLIGNHDVNALKANRTEALIEDASDTEESFDDEEAGF